jgi:hypothetical protein
MAVTSPNSEVRWLSGFPERNFTIWSGPNRKDTFLTILGAFCSVLALLDVRLQAWTEQIAVLEVEKRVHLILLFSESRVETKSVGA